MINSIHNRIQHLKKHEEFKKYFANTSWLIVERIIRMGVALFIGVYVARYLGPERFGLLNYVSSFVGLFIALAGMGLDGIVVRELINNPGRRNQILGSAFWLKLIGTLLMWLVILIATITTNTSKEDTLLIAIISFSAIFQALNVIDFNYQAEVKAKYIVRIQFTQLIISSIAKIVLINLNAELIWFAWIYCLDAAVLAIGQIYIYLKYSGKIWCWQWRWDIASNLLKDSWPLLLSGIVISLYMRIDQVMIKEMLGDREVGLYAAAVRISEAWYFIPVTITASLFPAIVNAKNKSKKLYYERLQRLYNLMVIIAVTIAIPITFLSPWVINFLYGETYLQAANVLSIHIWAGVFVFLGVASGKWLLSENLQIISFSRTFYGMLINITLNYFFIPEFGITGAASSTIISYMFAGYLLDFFNKKTKNMFTMKTKTLLMWKNS